LLYLGEDARRQTAKIRDGEDATNGEETANGEDKTECDQLF